MLVSLGVCVCVCAATGWRPVQDAASLLHVSLNFYALCKSQQAAAVCVTKCSLKEREELVRDSPSAGSPCTAPRPSPP